MHFCVALQEYQQMVVQFGGPSLRSHYEGKSIISISRKDKVVVNVVATANDTTSNEIKSS